VSRCCLPGTASIFALMLALACGPAPDTRDAAPPRFAKRYIPVDDEWRPEADIPKEPQKSPLMVIWEVSEFAPGSEPTPEQARTARELIEATERAARQNGWYDFQQGLADGFKLMVEDRRHYFNEEYIFDDRVLDPDRPEFLMYYGTPQGKKLAGVMYYTSQPEERGPQVGGPLTVWHYHVWARPNCLLERMLMIAKSEDGRCERGIPTSRSPEMLHVWLLDHPEGPFSTTMWLDPLLVQELVEERESERFEKRLRAQEER